MKLSLHRVIAEIKQLEAELSSAPFMDYVAGAALNKTGNVGLVSAEVFAAKAQGAVDAFMQKQTRLQKLRVARNLANATTFVDFMNTNMSIDEILSRKSNVHYIEMAVQTARATLIAANNKVEAEARNIDAKVEGQIAQTSASTKRLSQEEIDMLRKMFENSTGLTLVKASNLDKFIEDMTAYIKQFNLEVDFTLSEVNAQTLVEV